MDATPNVPLQSTARKATKRNRHQALDHHVAELQALIVDYVWSIDTVSFTTAQPITPHDRAMLRRYHAHYEDKYSPFSGRTTVRLIRPSTAVLLFVANRFRDHVVNRCDIAVDFIVASEADRLRLLALLDLLLEQPWRGHKRITVLVAGTTRYWAAASQGRNIAVYPKDDNGWMKVRLELRCDRARTCRVRGVVHISALLTFDDDDVMTLLDHDTRLSLIDWDKARRLIAEMARADEAERIRRRHSVKFGFDRSGLRRRYEHWLCRAFMDAEGNIKEWEELAEVPTQALLDHAPYLAPALARVRAGAPLLSRGQSANNAAAC